MLNTVIIIWTINVQKDINNQTGYTPSNLVNALLSVSARMANILSVCFHMTVSPKVRNNHSIINALAIDVNNISIHIFLFSVLFIFEKNMIEHIHVAISNHTKWKLKFWGLNIVIIFEIDDGKYVHVSSENVT